MASDDSVGPEKKLPKVKSDPVAELPIYNFKVLEIPSFRIS